MKLYAIKSPDGKIIDHQPEYEKCWTWESAARCCPELRDMATLSGSWWRKAERKGYRCVEVRLVEVTTAAPDGEGENT